MSSVMRSLNHLLVILTCAASLWAWLTLPELESYPIHWNARGEADGFSSKRGVLLVLSLMPLTAIFTHALMWGLTKMETANQSIENSGIVYDVTWHVCLWMFLVINIVIAVIYMGLVKDGAETFDSDLIWRVLPFLLGLMFVIIGNVLGKAKQNKYVGVKTPWTLKSKVTWEATHRMTAWLWVGGGAFMMLIPFVWTGMPAIIALIAVSTLISFVPIIYSYVFYQSASDKLE